MTRAGPALRRVCSRATEGVLADQMAGKVDGPDPVSPFAELSGSYPGTSAVFAVTHGQGHQPVRCVERQGAPQNAVGRRDHRRVETQTERKRGDGHGGKTGLPSERSERLSNVLKETRHFMGRR